MENLELKTEKIDLTPLEVLNRDQALKKTKKALTASEATEQLRLRMREKVRGIFHFYECTGGKLDFMYKEFKNDPLEKFSFVDKQIYTIPLGVALHLNKSGKYPEYGYVKNEAGQLEARVVKHVARYGFESLEFKQFDELNNKLI